MLLQAWGPTLVTVQLRDSIDELDVLITELTELRQALCRAELSGRPADDALWDAEASLRHVARRSEGRARILRRAIELNHERRSA
ncbi:hypothetical protein BH20ACT3_BH20ACT3_12160 [soil metagenome]